MQAASSQKGKHRLRCIAWLLGHDRKINASTIQPGWRTRLQSPNRQFQLAQPRSETDRGRVPCPTRRIILQTDMDQARQEGAGSQDHRPRPKADASLSNHAADPLALNQKIIRRLLKQLQIGLVFQATAYRLAIQHPIGLGACGTHCRAFGGIEGAELDPGFIGGNRHGTAQCIHLPHQVALTDATNRRVAGHLAEGFNVVAEQQRAGAGTCRCQRSLGAGMATTDNDDIEFSWK